MRCIAIVISFVCLAAAGCSGRAAVEGGIQPGVIAATTEDGDKVWVCHRGRWQEVGAPAGSAHSRHGDRVSRTPRGGGC